MLRRLGVVGAIVAGLCGCTRGPSVLVSVGGIGTDARSLQVMVSKTEIANEPELEPFNLEDAPPGSNQLRLDFPETTHGEVTIHVGAYQQRDAKGCLLGTGNSSTLTLTLTDGAAEVLLQPVSDPFCSGQRPLLLGVQPGLGSSAGNETLTLTGWGFHPGSQVQFNGTAAGSVIYRSALQLEVRTPAQAKLGPAEVKVTDRSGASHARADLFRFFSNAVDFSSLPTNDVNTVYDVGGLVAERFYPSNPMVLATMAMTMRQLQEVRILRVEPPLGIFNNRVDLKPLAPMGMQATPSGLAARDMTGDGIPDLVVAVASLNKVVLIKNNGTGGYTFDAVSGVFTVGANPQGLILTDLNGDKQPDVVTANMGDNSLSVLLNDGAGGFLPQVKYVTDRGPISVVAADIDQDGDLDLATVCYTDGTVRLVLGHGDGSFEPITNSPSMQVGMKPSYVEARDLNGDKIEDLIIVNEGSSNLTVLVNKSRGGQINPNFYNLTTTPNPQPFVLADLNGDAYEDLMVPCRGTDSTRPGVVDVFLNNKGGGFQGVTAKSFTLASTCTQVSRIAAVDATSDGLLDITALCLKGSAVLKNQAM